MHLLLSHVLNLGSFALVRDDLGRHVGNQLRCHNLERQKQVFNEDEDEHDFELRAALLPLKKVLDCGRLVDVALLVFALGSEKQNSHVDWNGNHGDQLHHASPATNSRSPLRNEPATKARHSIQFDFDLEQIGQEGEKRCQREHASEEYNETELNDSLIVEIDKTFRLWSHHQLLLNMLLHFDLLCSNLVIS